MKEAKVNLPFYCVADFISKYWNESQHSNIAETIIPSAIAAWEKRPDNTQKVRFVCQMPSKTGVYFRFFNVTKDTQGTLQISI